jgi:thiamine biosynthesis lipoprotein
VSPALPGRSRPGPAGARAFPRFPARLAFFRAAGAARNPILRAAAIRSFLRAAAAVALALPLCSCEGRGLLGGRVAVSDTRFALGSFLQITLVTDARGAEKARQTLQKAFDAAMEFETRVDYRNESGALHEFNRGTTLREREDETLFALVKEALSAAELTGGYFDPTVLPLVRLWAFDTDSPRLPEGAQVKAALARVGHKRVRVLGDSIVKPTEVELDLSGIAQGKAVDVVSARIRNEGYRDFLVNASGDIYASGRNAARRKWRIAIQDPVRQDRYSGIVDKSDVAVVTSGDYERFFMSGGRRYCHILNPFTGYPESDLRSVTILAPEAVSADYLSTAVFAMGSGKGLQFLLEHGIEGYLVFSRNGRIESVSTPGFWK